jgi:superfamily II DNA or RNA helicase
MQAAVYPFQNKAIRDVYQALGRGNNKILKLPTGSGKTYIAAAIIAHAVSKGRKVLFLVDRLSLLDQTANEFANLGIYGSIIQGENTTYQYGDDVVIASIQTLENWSSWPDINLVIVDECHDQRKALAEKMNQWTGVKWLGLTATPYTTGLGNTWTEVVEGPTVRELIDMGYLSDYQAWGVPPDLSQVKTKRGDFDQKQLGETVNNLELTGNILKHHQEHAAGRKTMVFAVDIAHSKAIASRFNEAGIPAAHIDCYADGEEKWETIKSFRAGEIQVLCSVTMLAKGFDVKDVVCVILARPTKSLSLYIQQVGRGLRTAEGKQDCIILDHAGNCSRFGLPDEDFSRPLCTKKKGTSSSDTAREEPKPKECPKCTFMKDPGVHECPNCGFKPERQSDVTEKDAVLVQLRGTKNKTIPMENKVEIMGQLLWIADKRKRSHGWAAHAFREIFDVWPRGDAKYAEPREASQRLQQWVVSRDIAFAKRRK